MDGLQLALVAVRDCSPGLAQAKLSDCLAVLDFQRVRQGDPRNCREVQQLARTKCHFKGDSPGSPL